VHPDGQLFEWITNGYPGSVMPAYGELLTEEQRWDLVNYIRTFGGK
jgi:mono/diheme cytochrome c family protein